MKHHGSERVPGIDLLRALAIVAVMMYHLSSHGIAMPAFVEHGWMGVDLFFVLSGYLIGWQLFRSYASGGAPKWWRFFVGRAFRILPAYYVVLAFYVMLPAWREGGELQPLWKYLTFTLNLSPDWKQGAAYSHAWSLCIEEHFYLLFPLIAWLLASRMTVGWFCTLTIGAIGGGILLRAWLWQHQIAPHIDAGDMAIAGRNFVEMIYNPTYTHFDGLMMGVMLAAIRAFRPAWWTEMLRHGWVFLMVGVAILAGCTQIQPVSRAGVIALFPLIALGCGLLLCSAASPASGMGGLSLPGARPLAILAFSLYLVHKQVYHWLDGAIPGLGRQSPMIALIVYILASLVAAAVLYWAVERPGLLLRKRWLQKKSTGGDGPYRVRKASAQSRIKSGPA